MIPYNQKYNEMVDDKKYQERNKDQEFRNSKSIFF
jgi:hypothetical protein